MKNSKTLKWIFKNTKKYLPAVLLNAVISAVISVGYIALAYFSSYIIDIATGQKQGNIVFYIVLILLLIIMQAVLYILNSSVRVRVQGKTEMHFKRNMFLSLSRKEYARISEFHSGDILNRFTSDIDIVVSGVTGIIPSAVSLIARLAAAITVLMMYSPKLTLVILVLGVVVGAAARIYSSFFKNIHKKVQESVGKTRSFMQECAENMAVIKSFNTAPGFSLKLGDLMNESYKLKLKRNLVSNISSVAVYLIFTGGYYAALSWGAFMVSADIMTFGTLTALLSIVSQIRAPITNISGIIPQYYSALASAERIIELENLADEGKPEENTKISEIYNEMESLNLKGVTFSYENSHETLKCADMVVKKGEIAALIGGSGEGKSTIFRLLLGLWTKYEGEINISTPSCKIPLTPNLRGLFAYVPQGNLILSGTVAENIRFCRETASDEEVYAAAKCADLYDFIMSLPDGFETRLGERGHGLSEGQVQRIAIARAVLSEAPVLLLDECTSALDDKTEKTVLENIKALNRTAIIISHRAAALDICDKIYSLDSGFLNILKGQN